MPMNRVAVAVALAAVAGGGCREVKRSFDPAALLPQGRLTVYASEEFAGIARQHARQFMQQHERVTVDVQVRSTRGAIVALLADSGRVAYTDRLLNAEEEAVDAGHPDSVRVAARHIGFGALVFVVHPSNPVGALPAADIPALVRSTAPTWDGAGGSGRMLIAVTGKNTGTYEVLAQDVAPGAGDLVPAFVGASSRAVMDFVAQQPGGLGVVPLSALPDTAAAGVRVLPLRVTKRGETYTVRPTQLSVYEQSYPLHYKLYLYTTGGLGLLPARFGGFVGSRVGQRALQTAGYVPETVPARTIQLQ